MSYPIKWVPVSDELEEERVRLFAEGSTVHKAVVSEPYGIHAAPAMAEAAKKVYNFKVRPDDIWIITYPKCGTTWTQVSLDQRACFILQNCKSSCFRS